MSAPVRFLVVAVAGWAAIRFVTLGDVSGFTVSHAMQPSAGTLPPIAATEFPPLPPVMQLQPQQYAFPPFYGPYPSWPAGTARVHYLPYPEAMPVSLPARPIPPRPQWQLAAANTLSRPEFYAPLPSSLDVWGGRASPLSRLVEAAQFPLFRRARPIGRSTVSS